MKCSKQKANGASSMQSLFESASATLGHCNIRLFLSHDSYLSNMGKWAVIGADLRSRLLGGFARRGFASGGTQEAGPASLIWVGVRTSISLVGQDEE
jgi:hypothetical protein